MNNIYIMMFNIVLLTIIIRCLNEKYKKMHRYQDEYQKVKKFIDGVPVNIDVVNTGSNYALYGLNYTSDNNVKGFNLSTGSQSLNYDYKILTRYKNCVRKQGTVIIVVCFLVFGFIDYEDDEINNKYYFFLGEKEIEKYSFLKYILHVKLPIFESWKNIFRVILNRDINSDMEKNTYNKALLDAKSRINCWKKEFKLKDMEHARSAEHLEKTFVKTRQILTKMLELSINEGLRPIIVIPPVSQILSQNVSEEFIDKVLYQNINEANKYNVPVCDYLKDNRFNSYKLYLNSDFLNEAGQKMFTKVLMDDINKINE